MSKANFVNEHHRQQLAEMAQQTLDYTTNLPSEGIPGFDWPEYTHERARIKANNRRYTGLSLSETMLAMAGLKGKKYDKIAASLHDQDDCHELKVGDIVPLKIMDITKKGVIFDNAVYKEDISCNVNLYQYEKLRHFLPKDPIRCKIMSKSGNHIVVDPFVVMFDEWIESKLDDGRHGKVPARAQYDTKKDRSVTVKHLHLLKGGYAGSVRIDPISDFVGQDVYADAFIPGSQIVLNIENDFSRWEGADVKAFVYNYMKRPGTANAMSVVCSAKEVIKFKGQQDMIKIFAEYTEDSDQWKAMKKDKHVGIVTGVLKSAKKCGVFVEMEGKNITGMIETPASELVNYQPGKKLSVCWSHFDEPMRYNHEVDQMQHVDPYVIENGILKEFNIKPIFKIAE